MDPPAFIVYSLMENFIGLGYVFLFQVTEIYVSEGCLNKSWSTHMGESFIPIMIEAETFILCKHINSLPTSFVY